MVSKKVTDQQVIEALETAKSVRGAAKLLGMAQSSISQRKQLLIKRGYSPEYNHNHLVPEGYKVKGTSTLYGQDSQPIMQWVKSSVDKEQASKLLENLCNSFIKDLPKYSPVDCVIQKYNPELLTVYPLGDPHIGMMAWGKETETDWDLKIAETVYTDYFDRIVKSAPPCKHAVIINLGDFFHYDNLDGFTAKSHNILDRDGRYAKMIEVGIRIIRMMIRTALNIHETVKIINVSGNHDEVSSIFLRLALKHVYENEPRVIVDDSPGLFHYIRHGKTLIGTHHGHKCKMDLLPGVMACDRAIDWGETQFRYWLTGHIHSDTKIDKAGCIIESFRTLAPRDAYAHDGGWRNGRSLKCIVYSTELGEVERHTVSIGNEV